MCSLPSALPHAVPMVPKALIGYCKVWDRTPVRLSIPTAIGCTHTSVKYTLTAHHTHRCVAPAPIGYCTCQETLIVPRTTEKRFSFPRGGYHHITTVTQRTEGQRRG
ncbi:hypothetical protein INR49_001597 [Caranx melampygus]|nr:hypothetical protein INR49_001597 [Caranx melampygus]